MKILFRRTNDAIFILLCAVICFCPSARADETLRLRGRTIQEMPTASANTQGSISQQDTEEPPAVPREFTPEKTTSIFAEKYKNAAHPDPETDYSDLENLKLNIEQQTAARNSSENKSLHQSNRT